MIDRTFAYHMEEVDQWRGGKLVGTYNHIALIVGYDNQRAWSVDRVEIYGWAGPGSAADVLVDEVEIDTPECREIVAHLSAKERKAIESRVDEYLAGTRADAMAA